MKDSCRQEEYLKVINTSRTELVKGLRDDVYEKRNNKMRTVLKLCALTPAGISIAFVTVGALAAVTTQRVGTSGVYVTRWFHAAALVHVYTFKPVETRVPVVALARVRSWRVHANSRVNVAVVSIWSADARAFVHV